MKISDSVAVNAPTLSQSIVGLVIAEKYRVESLLGRGGMGSVYEGTHLLLERPIAIKVMDTGLSQDERAQARFLREAKAAARMEHPNAVTIHDFGVWQGDLAYIVMEYIRGNSLRDWLNKNKKASPQQTIEWLSQICSAVTTAHQQGIIHRDLKPENIMLKELPEGGTVVKVVDFGLAKLVSSDSGSITQTGEVVGTPYYMAPEFYDGENVDHRADIYALGIITYELLTGRAPFVGTVEKIIAGHLFQIPKPLSESDPDLSAELNDVVFSALKKKQHERISSASEFAEKLKNSLSHNSQMGQTSPLNAQKTMAIDEDIIEKISESAGEKAGAKTDEKTGEKISKAVTLTTQDPLPLPVRRDTSRMVGTPKTTNIQPDAISTALASTSSEAAPTTSAVAKIETPSSTNASASNSNNYIQPTYQVKKPATAPIENIAGVRPSSNYFMKVAVTIFGVVVLGSLLFIARGNFNSNNNVPANNGNVPANGVINGSSSENKGANNAATEINTGGNKPVGTATPTVKLTDDPVSEAPLDTDGTNVIKVDKVEKEAIVVPRNRPKGIEENSDRKKHKKDDDRDGKEKKKRRWYNPLTWKG